MATEIRVRVTGPDGRVFVALAGTVEEAAISYPPADGYELQLVRGVPEASGFRVTEEEPS